MLGIYEIVVIVIVGILALWSLSKFGKKSPEIARNAGMSVGEGLRGFKEGIRGIPQEIKEVANEVKGGYNDTKNDIKKELKEAVGDDKK